MALTIPTPNIKENDKVSYGSKKNHSRAISCFISFFYFAISYLETPNYSFNFFFVTSNQKKEGTYFGKGAC